MTPGIRLFWKTSGFALGAQGSYQQVVRRDYGCCPSAEDMEGKPPSSAVGCTPVCLSAVTDVRHVVGNYGVVRVTLSSHVGT